MPSIDIEEESLPEKPTISETAVPRMISQERMTSQARFAEKRPSL
jgi:hypothetical protein